MRSYGAAVVGTGFIGPVHVEALRRLGHDVVGILGSTPAKGRAAAERLNLRRAYESYEELLADPQVRVVHIASPNRYHFDQAKQAIAAGKHVVCEKPLAMTSAETAALAKLADRSAVVAAVNYNVRFYPLCLHAREVVHGGALGPVYHVTGSYLQDWLLYDTDFNWRVLAAEGGPLRAVADIGTHWLDLVTFITGLEVEAVCADLRTVHPVRLSPHRTAETFRTAPKARRQRGVRPADAGDERKPVPIDTEDYGSVLLRFRGGAAGALTVSQVTAGRKNCIRFDIAAQSGSLSWDSEDPNTLWIGHRHRPNERLTRDPALLAAAARPFADSPGGHAEGFPDTFKQLFRAVYAAIENSETGADLLPVPYPTFADGHRDVLLCEKILQSHRERRWIEV